MTEGKATPVGAGEDANAGASENKEGTGANDQNKQGGQQTPKEFVVPRRNADFYDARQNRLKERDERKKFFQHKQGESGEEGGEGGDDAPLTRAEYNRMREEDRFSWQEEQDKRLMSQSDVTAINGFLAKAENERFRKYEKEGLAILKDPAYSHADIGLIFKGLAYDDALAEGAKRGAKADEKSQRNSFGGSERTQEPEVEGYTPDKHKEFKAKLRQGKASFGKSE